MGGIGINADVFSFERRETINNNLQKNKSVEDIIKVFDKGAKRAEKKGDTKTAQNSRELSEFIRYINNEATKTIPGEGKSRVKLRATFFKEVLNAAADVREGNTISKLDIAKLGGDDGYISEDEINNRMAVVKYSSLFSGGIPEPTKRTKKGKQDEAQEVKTNYPTYDKYPIYDENFNVIGYKKLQPRNQLRN